jgi:hypothetical protein
MALLLFEGWDYLATAQLPARGWAEGPTANTAFISSGGRTGGQRLNANRGAGGSYDSTYKLVPGGGASATWIWGGYVTIIGESGSTNQCCIVAFGETTSTWHVYLRYTGATGLFAVHHSGGTQLCISSGHAPFALDDSAYLELKVTVHDSTGSVELRLNGAVVATATNVDTRNAGSALPTYLHLGQVTAQSASSGIAIDDMYLCDDVGSAPTNTFLGDVRVATLRPSGAGNSTQFVPSAGSNYQNVDETLVDGDTTYNAESTVSDKDTFAMGDMPEAVDAIFGTMQLVYWRKDDAGPRSGRQVVRSGGTDYEGSTVIMLDSYKFDEQIRVVDPATAVAWTESGVNAIEAGYKVQA